MTDVQSARQSLDQAQKLLDQVEADLTRLDELIGWLAESRERAEKLDAYIRGNGITDVETVNAASDDSEITPPVGNEDAAWEALSSSHERMMRLLRAVTAEQTSALDEIDRRPVA